MVENDRNSLNLRKIRRKQIKSETDLLAFDTLLSQLDFDIQYVKELQLKLITLGKVNLLHETIHVNKEIVNKYVF